jgi:hypothetical protein
MRTQRGWGEKLRAKEVRKPPPKPAGLRIARPTPFLRKEGKRK